MTPELLLSFALVSIVFIAIPGPNVLVIVSTSLIAGQRRGLQTVAGTCTAMLGQLLVAALATTWLLSLLAEGLLWLKWGGVCYLLFLGLRSLLAYRRRAPLARPGALGSFQRGFWVSLTNPKTILFFSAFLPQFVSPAAGYLPQILVLSALFWLLAVVIDCLYALLAARASRLFANSDRQHLPHAISGGFYLGASGFLANTRL